MLYYGEMNYTVDDSIKDSNKNDDDRWESMKMIDFDSDWLTLSFNVVVVK